MGVVVAVFALPGQVLPQRRHLLLRLSRFALDRTSCENNELPWHENVLVENHPEHHFTKCDRSHV